MLENIKVAVEAASMVLTALALQAPSAGKPSQFNLLCTGIRTIGAAGEQQPFSVEYRVDLKVMKYCFDECDRALLDIAWEDPQWIGLEGSKQSDSPPSGSTVAFVNRVTGKYTSYIVGRLFRSEGQCVPAQFKGFPAPETKF